MAVGDWLRPPRHLVILFLGIALLLMATLAWLGWRLFDQDRALEQQRVQVRLEHAADLLTAELARELTSVEEGLARLAALPAPDLPDSAERLADRFSPNTVVLVMVGDVLAAYPHGRLLYYPGAATAPQSDARVFARGEALEFRQRDWAGAARTYRRLAQSRDSVVRAGAFLRLARTERKAGHQAAALDAYDALARLAETPVGGLPAELVARHARLSVLDSVGRAGDARQAAESLRVDLENGRWHLTRAQYEYYAVEVCYWVACGGEADSAADARKALAAGTAWLWDGRSARGGDGHELVVLDEGPVLVVWHRSGERMVAEVGGATHLTRDWIGLLAPLLQQENVRVAFSDVNGTRLTPPVGADGQLSVTRTVADTRLPWSVRVVSANPDADFAQLRDRRRLMLLGLVTLALFVAVGLYGVMRGVSRELEVARLQSDFVSAVSHEFRTPLTSLKQLAEMLSSGRVTSDERRACYYGIMERESGRLHRLVEGLLDFGRMEAGAMEFHWNHVSPDTLVRNVVTEFEGERSESGIHVELTADGALPQVRADPEALGRAVWNLLDNAFKYSPERDTVRVSVSRRDAGVAIAVRDEGTGIPPSQRDTIFQKFVRGTASDGHGAKGTGIGLAMVKHIVEAHRGEIRVDSEVGQGSTFTILLPVEE